MTVNILICGVTPPTHTHTLLFLGLRGFSAKARPAPGKLGRLVTLDHSHLPRTLHSQPWLHLLFRGRSSRNWGSLWPLLSLILLLRALSLPPCLSPHPPGDPPPARLQVSATPGLPRARQGAVGPQAGRTVTQQEHSHPQMWALCKGPLTHIFWHTTGL